MGGRGFKSRSGQIFFQFAHIFTESLLSQLTRHEAEALVSGFIETSVASSAGDRLDAAGLDAIEMLMSTCLALNEGDSLYLPNKSRHRLQIALK